MRWKAVAVAVAVVVQSLACGGGGGGDGEDGSVLDQGPSVSDSTLLLGQTLTEEGDPEATYGSVGEEVAVQDFTIVIEDVFYGPINFQMFKQSFRRYHAEDVRSVNVLYKLRNDTALAISQFDPKRRYYGSDGVTHGYGPYYDRHLAELTGRSAQDNVSGGFPPGQWVECVTAFFIPEGVGSSHNWVWTFDDVRIAPETGRRYTVITDRIVIDLGEPDPAPPEGIAMEAVPYDQASGR